MNPITSNRSGIQSNAFFEALRAVGSKRAFSIGDTICYQGDTDHGIMLVVSGTVGLTSVTTEGDTLWIGQVSTGHILGDAAFLSETAQAFEVTAITQANVITISKSALKAVLKRNPSYYADLARILARKHHILAEQFVESKKLSARGRICGELVRLSRLSGVDPNIYVIRPVPIFSKLGEQLSTTRETVSRTVSDLQKQGILRRMPGAIVVERLTALKASIK